MTSSLLTERLELRPGTPDALRAELEGRDALERALQVRVPEAWPPELYDADAVRYTLAQIGDRPDGGPFGFYYFVLRGGGDSPSPTLVGAGGFKSPPDERGEVEIGYAVARSFQRRGIATEAVKGMVDFAFRDPRVRTVVGQTLASLVPSIGVLEKAGFRFAGSGQDEGAPPGERVIRYELSRADYEQRIASRQRP